MSDTTLTDTNSKKRKADVALASDDGGVCGNNNNGVHAAADASGGDNDNNNIVTQLLSSLSQETKKLQEELKQKDKKLTAAVKLIAKQFRYLSSFATLPEELMEDPVMVTEIIKNNPYNLKWSDIPTSLQSNADVVVQAMKSFANAGIGWNDIPSCLQTNPDVIMQAIESFGFYLKWFDIPASMRNNPQVVLKAIRCMKTKKYPLQLSERDVSKELLRSNREIALGALQLNLKRWDQVNPTHNEWKNDVKLSICALRFGEVNTAEWRNHAPKLTEEVIRQAIFDGRIWFRHVPEDLKKNMEFCRRVVFFLGEQINTGPGLLAEEVFEFQSHMQHDIPRLADDPAVWSQLLQLIDNHPNKACLALDIHTTFSYLPAAVREDVDLMIRAYNLDPRALRYFGTNLHGATRGIIAEKPECLLYATSEFISSFPDFVRDQLGPCSRTIKCYYHCDKIAELATKTPNDVMNDPVFATTWLQEAGLPLVDGVPDDWKTDQSKFRLVAQHCRDYKWKYVSFQNCDDVAMFGDAGFMVDILHLEPRLCGYASNDLVSNDWNVAMLGLTSYEFFCECVQEMDRNRGHRHFHRVDNRPSYRAFTKETFTACLDTAACSLAFETFLCGVHFSCSTGMTSSLGLLNHSELKESIFNYLGVPRNADTVRSMRKVMSNLYRWKAEHPAENPSWES